MLKDQNVWKWKNTAHITKMGIEGTVALASLAGAITTILIATKVIAGPASLALVASPVGIAVLFIAAVYFAAAAYSSYQQMHKNEATGVNGKDGKDGKDAGFSALPDDALRNGTIVEETVKDSNSAGIEQLSLKLSATDYTAFIKDENTDGDITLHVLSAGKSVEVKFKHVDPANDNGNYKVQLTSVGGKDQLAEMKAELGIAADSKSLKVLVSDKSYEALKSEVPSKLVNIALANKSQSVN